jgi:hypothetical protein
MDYISINPFRFVSGERDRYPFAGTNPVRMIERIKLGTSDRFMERKDSQCPLFLPLAASS